MIAALDSSFDAPTLAQAETARAGGVRAWGGYLATQQQAGAFNLAAPWSRLAFWNVQQAGLLAIAFCSGWDDPIALRRLAAEWGVRLMVDVEDAIRGDGPWVGPFLQASGAGLYGLLEVHRWPAPCRIVAEYPAGGCPGATWPASPAPREPHGWQCQGTHREFGLSVDRSALDDWFAGGADVLDFNDPVVKDLRNDLTRILGELFDGQDEVIDFTSGQVVAAPASWPNWMQNQTNAILAAVAKLQQPAVDVDALAGALVAAPGFSDALAAAVAHRLGAALDKA